MKQAYNTGYANDLAMWKALTKFVLFDDQKHRMTILTLFLFHRRSELPLNITTGDEF